MVCAHFLKNERNVVIEPFLQSGLCLRPFRNFVRFGMLNVCIPRSVYVIPIILMTYNMYVFSRRITWGRYNTSQDSPRRSSSTNKLHKLVSKYVYLKIIILAFMITFSILYSQYDPPDVFHLLGNTYMYRSFRYIFLPRNTYVQTLVNIY